MKKKPCKKLTSALKEIESIEVKPKTEEKKYGYFPPTMTGQQQEAIIKTAEEVGLDWWVENGIIKTAPKIPDNYSPHSYHEYNQGKTIYQFGKCNYCDCEMYSSSSSGSYNPFGKCPNRPPKS
jgi:hypothetical protein